MIPTLDSRSRSSETARSVNAILRIGALSLRALCRRILVRVALLLACIFPLASAHADMQTGMQWLQAQV